MKDKILSGVVLLGAFALLLAFASPTFRQGEPGMAGRGHFLDAGRTPGGPEIQHYYLAPQRGEAGLLAVQLK